MEKVKKPSTKSINNLLRTTMELVDKDNYFISFYNTADDCIVFCLYAKDVMDYHSGYLIGETVFSVKDPEEKKELLRLEKEGRNLLSHRTYLNSTCWTHSNWHDINDLISILHEKLIKEENNQKKLEIIANLLPYTYTNVNGNSLEKLRFILRVLKTIKTNKEIEEELINFLKNSKI